MAAIFQDGGHFRHENHFLDSFLLTYAILMILESNHTFLTMQNLNFDLRNSANVHLTKYETKITVIQHNSFSQNTRSQHQPW